MKNCLPDYELISDYCVPRVGIFARKGTFGKNHEKIEIFEQNEAPNIRFSKFRSKSCQSILVRFQCGQRALNVLAGYRAPHALTESSKKFAKYLAEIGQRRKSAILGLDANACVALRFDKTLKFRSIFFIRTIEFTCSKDYVI